MISDSDRELLNDETINEIVYKSCARAIKQGVEGYVDGIRVNRMSWPFALQDISVPVQVWHGEDDLIVPSPIGNYLASELPNAELHPVRGGGHFFLFNNWRLVLESI